MDSQLEELRKATDEYVKYERLVRDFRNQHFSFFVDGVTTKEMERTWTPEDIEEIYRMNQKLESLHKAHINAFRTWVNMKSSLR